jgi:hypothetical protein
LDLTGVFEVRAGDQNRSASSDGAHSRTSVEQSRWLVIVEDIFVLGVLNTVESDLDLGLGVHVSWR